MSEVPLNLLTNLVIRCYFSRGVLELSVVFREQPAVLPDLVGPSAKVPDPSSSRQGCRRLQFFVEHHICNNLTRLHNFCNCILNKANFLEPRFWTCAGENTSLRVFD